MLLAIEDPAVQIRYFSKIWTAKESYLKCIGTGIRQKLNLDLSEVLDGKTYEEVYHFFFLDGEDFQAAVCLKTKKCFRTFLLFIWKKTKTIICNV